MIALKRTFLAVLLLILAGCGGGGGGGGEGGPGGAISGNVPYLVSGPTLTSRSSPTISGRYDVTVTLEADGPTGVMSADLWLNHDSDTSNFTHLELAKTAGTRRWTGTTNPLLPLAPGSYHVDSIVLEDGANPLRAGWYTIMPPLSLITYYVDERITSGLTIEYYGGGLSSRQIGRITLQ